MVDVINKKQMYNSVITGKENSSKDWNCIISMFLTSFNVYFVFVYAYFICICLKTPIWIFWDKIWLFWWAQIGNPTCNMYIISSFVIGSSGGLMITTHTTPLFSPPSKPASVLHSTVYNRHKIKNESFLAYFIRILNSCVV